MIEGMAKIAAVCTVAYCSLSGMDNFKDQIRQFTNLPKRVMTAHELKQIHRLIHYDLVDGSGRAIRLSEFCKAELTAAGRDPGKDYWETPYRLYFKSILYSENSTVTLNYHDADRFVVVSAGVDQRFLSRDDITSRSDTDEDVQELVRQIEAKVKQEEETAKKKI